MNTRSTMFGLLSGVMILSSAMALAATEGAAEKAVIAAENQSATAVRTNNAELMGSLLADNYVSTDYDGTMIVGKAANIEDFKLGTSTSYEMTDLKVATYGDTAIATGVYAIKGTYKGKPVDSHGRFTDTWVKLNGKWLTVASHYSHIKK